MGPRTQLSNSTSLVIDASVAINLNASGFAAEIIAALPERIVILDVVTDELEYGKQKGRRDSDEVRKLVSAGLMEIKTLGQAGLTHLEGMVIGPASDTLDDGEAATIAYALEANAVAVIDERKAIRICNERFPRLGLRCTVDIFENPKVQHALGQKLLAEALFNALRDARMRVLPNQIEWVVNLIGANKAAQCPSLPALARRQE